MVKNGSYKNCPVCDVKFYVIPAQDKKGRGKSCSIQCKAVLQTGLESKKKGRTFHSSWRADKRTCRTCGVEFRSVNDHTGSKGGMKARTPQIYCSHSCYVKGNRISGFEDSVHEYLSSYSNRLVRQIRKLNWTFDFAINGTNILIEADGSYWHSKPEQKKRDDRKNEWCTKNGFELFRIDELSFYKNKQSACHLIIDRMLKLDSELIVKKNGKKYKFK